MFTLNTTPLLWGLLLLFAFVRPAHAFGAGNIASISKVEGENWRHGDIEDVLLTIVMARAAGGRKFDKMNVSRVYFGNWLRDYSQAIDVGTVKSVSAEAIRLLLSVLGFLTFGYGSREFEVTADRLGCYRPEDHIDNPKNYADNIDARQYDSRLRAPVDERTELGIDSETGLKNYIASERMNIMTSAKHVRNLFGRCIELGRSYNRSKRKEDLHEALRLLGTGLHCLEDYFAHSNYTELALIELGERDIFPHVGRDVRLNIPGARQQVYPVVTGTFGGVDFLHSVTGEVSDKLTQNEIQELEGTLQQSKKNDNSVLKNLLDKIPDGIFGGDNKKQKLDQIQQDAATSQLQQMSVSPRDPEEFTKYVGDVFKQIMPAIQYHDELLQGISEALDRIPILPKIIEQLEEQLFMFVFGIIAPFILPVIQQIKNELMTGSSEIIESSKAEQHVVFEDDRSSDPTHSMLSKDHFTNILNEIAGRTASKVVAWVVPQLMEAWDDESIDVNRTLNRIIYGVLHHPAQREMGEDGARDGRRLIFRSVEQWWQEMDRGQQDEYRRKLSRRGVEHGENHKEGVHDSGHGCGKKLGMHKNFGGSGGAGSMEDRIAGAAAGAILGGVSSGLSSVVQSQTGYQMPTYKQQESSGDGSFGSLLSGAASSLLSGGGFSSQNTESFSDSRRNDDGGYTQTTTQYGRDDEGGRYGQAEYKQTQYGDGGRRSEYSRYEQDEDNQGRTSGYGYQETTETRPSHGGGYEERTESRWENNQSSRYNEQSQSDDRREDRYEQQTEERPEESSGNGLFGDVLGGLARKAEDAFKEGERRRNEGGGGGGWFS